VRNTIEVLVVAGEIKATDALHGCQVQGIAWAEVVLRDGLVHCLHVGGEHIQNQ
jgi:hypothetical protein